MEVTQQDSENLTSVLKIVLEQEDYEQKFIEELKKQKNKSQMKGFRKGKTPMSFLKKVYGQQVLANVVMDTVNESLSNYISEKELDILGQPLPNADQEMYNYDPNNLKDMTFLFDVGLAPQFEIQGMEDAFDLHKVTIDDEIITKELEDARRRFGTRDEAEDGIEEKDILTISAWELDGEEKKKDGWETGFTIMVETIEDAAIRDSLLGGKAGDEITFDIYTLEGDKDEKYVKKYLLNLDEDEEKEIGNMFIGKVDKIQRLNPAEMNEEFFQKYFGNDDIKTEEEARAKIREEMEGYYKKQATLVMNRKVMEHVMEKTSIEVPEDFLKRWLLETNEKAKQEDIDKEFPDFRDNLRWTLIKNKLSKKYDIQVTQEEIIEKTKEKVMGYMQGYPMDQQTLNDMIMRLLQDREQVNRIHEEIQADKIFEALESDLNTKEEPISVEGFKDVVKKLNESVSN